MVLPAVLRHPARDPEQAARRPRAGEFDHHPRVHAVARYVGGAFGELQAALSAIPADLLCGRGRPWLSRLAGAGGRLCGRGPGVPRLLLRVFSPYSLALWAYRG